tara:strand:+ start:743 stop:1495 length:753 start_codon:yes stop_codon:yes gene_type:complete
MKKNKKTLSITALAIGLFAVSMSAVRSQEIIACGEPADCQEIFVGLDLFPTQPTNLVGEVGFSEERIDGGLFTHSNALFAKVNATVGTVYGKDIITSLEYGNGKEGDFFGGYLGLASNNYYFGTRLAPNSADGDLTGDTDFEFNFGYVYEPMFLGLLLGVDVAIVSGGAYDVSLNAERDIASLFGVDVTAYAEVGKTWEYSADYEYTLGALRGSYDLYDGTLYAQLSVVDNEIQTDGFESSLQIGFTRSF